MCITFSYEGIAMTGGSLAGRLAVRRAVVLASGVALLALMVTGATASAFSPTGDYVNFGDCPLGNTSVVSCVYSTTTSGEVKIGTTGVPIKHTITLQGGLSQNEETGATEWHEAADGNTLSKTAQTVPGGLLGIMAPAEWPTWLQEWFNEFINTGPTGVTATTELVGAPSWNQENLEERSGTGVILPVRVHLNNAFLGSGCYIGSASSPVSLQLTTGTTSPPAPNSPITGTLGTITFKHGGALLIATGDKLVNNSFSAPYAEGCGEGEWWVKLLVSAAVDLKLGLPSAAGHNTAILQGNLEQGAAAAVKASE
jgi:hypothetical protein